MLLKGGTLVQLYPPSIARADLRIDGDVIVARGARLAPKGGEPVEDCRGRIILPGFVCAHTHTYSALSRGMPAPGRPLPEADFKRFVRRTADGWSEPEYAGQGMFMSSTRAGDIYVSDMSDHGFRKTYSVADYQRARASGANDRQALLKTSHDLGHNRADVTRQSYVPQEEREKDIPEDDRVCFIQPYENKTRLDRIIASRGSRSG